MKKRTRVTLAVLALGLVIFAYNALSLHSGRCTVAAFFGASPLALILLVCNIVALLVLVLYRVFRRSDPAQMHCPCGSLLHPQWHYCPCCGSCRHLSDTR